MLTDTIKELDDEEKEDENLDSKGIDSSFEFVPQNPFTVNIPNDLHGETIGNPGFPVEPEKAGFFESAKEEFKELSTNYHILHYAESHVPEKPSIMVQSFYPGIANHPLYKQTQDGWNPKVEVEKLTNIDPKFVPRLLAARNPNDFQYILDDIYSMKRHDEVMENGSFMGKIVGGAIALTPIGSLENWIPLAALATKAKVASGAINSIVKNLPFITGGAAIRAGSQQMDKVDGNLPDFLKDSFVDAAFGTLFFGVIGGSSSLINLSEFNGLKENAKKYLQGISYEHVVNPKGELKGFKAVDTTNGSISAAKVTMAQELADSAFHKGGLFKIPYVGDASLALLSGNVPGFKYLFGSPLVRLKTSKYKSASAFADNAFDHFITTEGEAKGGTRPFSFEHKVKRTRAMLTSLQAQTIALHAERNGYSNKPRPLIGIQNAFSAFKQKSIETLSRETQSTDYISAETFMDEVQGVLYSEISHDNAAVNEAATIYRKVIDNTWKDYRAAHNLPENWLPPKTATAYLMRVYDTKYLNENMGQWISVVSKWLKDSDAIIEQHLSPIAAQKKLIKDFEEKYTNVIRELGSPEKLPGEQKLLNYSKGRNPNLNENTLKEMKAKLKSMEEQLQDKLRQDPELFIHVDDPNNFSAKEAKELKALLKPIREAEKAIEEQKTVISDLKKQKSSQLSRAKLSKTKEKAKPKAEKFVDFESKIKQEEEKLHELNDKLFTAQDELNVMAHSNQINPRFFTKDENIIRFRNPDERLRFREIHNTDKDREMAAEAYYHSIMNMNPEDIIADVFGKMTGKTSENVLKKRTLPVPDSVLYANNFMTKDLYSKTANYVNYLSKRTHLKTSFQNVTVNGDFNELAVNLLEEHKNNRSVIEERIKRLNEQPNSEKLIQQEKKALRKEKHQFESIKEDMKYLYEDRMMGLNRRSDRNEMIRRTWMSLTSATNLHNLPATQITDLGFIGFQHGIWPFIRDGVYPLIDSMGSMLKTKDSEALRKMAPHIDLGLQDVGNNYANRNWHSELQPYINMGRISGGVQKYAHFSAVTDLSPYIDNGIQHLSGSVIQSRFMELLHKELEGTLDKSESLYLRKYGIDPKIWAKRMVKSYEDAGGFKTKLGGFNSKVWQWQDLEASNLFNNSVFRGIQNTLVWKGMADSPFFADNILGLFFHTFTGWGYAATNRYLIPSLQQSDASLLLKVLWMSSIGSLVSPIRRVSRGEDPWPEDMTWQQRAYEAWNDSGVFSSVSNVMNLINLMSGDRFLGDLKNDKFRTRMRTGIFGMSDVVSSTANRFGDIFGMVNSGLDEKDLKTAAHMGAITGAMYMHHLSDIIIESWNLPRNKRAAEAE